MKTAALLSNHSNKKTANGSFFNGKNEQSRFFTPTVQAKFTVNEPGDAYEQEADAVADKVMRMPVHFGFGMSDVGSSVPKSEIANPKSNTMPYSQISRKCADCEEEDNVQRKESNGGGGQAAPSIVNDVIASSGKPLDSNTQQFMESRMGHDFSHVQVHTDGKAAESATAVNALAYTSGNHIVFNSGQYQPDTEGGKRLLAHELVHVGQQNQNIGLQSKTIQREEVKETKPKEKTPEEKYLEALKKIGEAFLETPTGKEIKEKLAKTPLAVEVKQFFESLHGKIIAGTAVAGATAAVLATKADISLPIPKIPLGGGLSLGIDVEGKDRKMMFTLSYKGEKAKEPQRPKVNCPLGFKQAQSSIYAGKCCRGTTENERDCCNPSQITKNAMFPICCPAGKFPNAGGTECTDVASSWPPRICLPTESVDIFGRCVPKKSWAPEILK